MKAKELIEIYTATIEDAAQQGVDSVPLSELKRINAEIIRIAAESPDDVAVGEASLEHCKAVLAANADQHRHRHEFDLEMVRATIATGQSALKSSLLINGGAAVAVLAFLGNAWSKSIPQSIVSQAAYGLSLFVWGVLAAAAASGASYVSQAGFGDEFGKASQRIGAVGRGLAILLVSGAYALFACGAWQTYLSLTTR